MPTLNRRSYVKNTARSKFKGNKEQRELEDINKAITAAKDALTNLRAIRANLEILAIKE